MEVVFSFAAEDKRQIRRISNRNGTGSNADISIDHNVYCWSVYFTEIINSFKISAIPEFEVLASLLFKLEKRDS